MRSKVVSALIVLSLVCLPLYIISEGQATSTMTVMMGGNLKSEIVAGLIHNITIDLSAPASNVTLKAFYSGGFTASNFTNNYSWSCKSGVWADDLYNYYIQDESEQFGNSYCFQIAIDSTSLVGTWDFIYYADGLEVGSSQIPVAEPVAGIQMSAPTIYFQIMPYGTGAITSWMPNNLTRHFNVTTKNIGNVPLDFDISFESMNSQFTTTNSTGIYYPGETRTHYVSFQASAMSPRKFTVKAFVSGEPQLILTPNTVTTKVTPQTTFDVVVTVARPGYSIFQMDGLAVQYLSMYQSNYRDQFTLDMYITGNKTIYFGQEMENLTFDTFFSQGAEDTEEQYLVLSETVEQKILANVTCTIPPLKDSSLMAYAHFNIRIDGSTTTGTFTSNVVISPSDSEDPAAPPVSPSVIVVIILVIVFLVIGLFMFRAYKNTEEQKRKDLEEKIRRKKEKAKKQRRN